MVVQCRRTTVLIDCGFSLREIVRRLARAGLEPADLAAIVLTHEHADHASGAGALARRFRIPLWLTAGTRDVLGFGEESLPGLGHFADPGPFAIGDIELRPYTVPHDAREPCQLVFSNGARRLGLLTDAGHVTAHMTSRLRDCDALILECNHDPDMLADSDYPDTLKARIRGPHGHLDNESAAGLLAALDTGRLQHIVAAHLSEKNNTPWLARAALAGALGGAGERVVVASQEGGLAWRELI
jgi:phosphoribosyl 1,2-cyclic phosphodiesterase